MGSIFFLKFRGILENPVPTDGFVVFVDGEYHPFGFTNDVVLWLVLGVVTCIFPLSYVAVFYIIRNLNMMSEAYNRANGLV